MRDLGGADAKRQRAESAVRAGVAVAADDGSARLSEAQFRADHMNNSLPIAAQREEANAELLAIGFQLPDLCRRLRVHNREAPVQAVRCGRCGMVHRGYGALGTSHPKLPLPQQAERLRRSHLMDQMKVDIENRGRVRPFGPDKVRIPDLLEQSTADHTTSLLHRSSRHFDQFEPAPAVFCLAVKQSEERFLQGGGYRATASSADRESIHRAHG